jgi:hypothetical protein
MSYGFSSSVKVPFGVSSKVKHTIVSNVTHTENRCTCESVGKPQRKQEVTVFFRCFPLPLCSLYTQIRRDCPLAMTQWIDLLDTILAFLTPVEIMRNLICPFTFPQNYFSHLFSSLNTFFFFLPFFPQLFGYLSSPLYRPITLARFQIL